MTPGYLISAFVYVCGEIIDRFSRDEGSYEIDSRSKINEYLTYYFAVIKTYWSNLFFFEPAPIDYMHVHIS